MSERLNHSKTPRERMQPLPSEIDSRLLLGSCGRVLIQHRGQTYELRETRYGKLILTK